MPEIYLKGRPLDGQAIEIGPVQDLPPEFDAIKEDGTCLLKTGIEFVGERGCAGSAHTQLHGYVVGVDAQPLHRVSGWSLRAGPRTAARCVGKGAAIS